jgi:hypothetical protein
MNEIEIDPYEEKPAVISDISNFDFSQREISITADVKNINLLANVKIEKLWLFCAKEKDIDRIFKIIQPEYVNLYQLLAKDLTCLEQLKCKTLVLDWNTKALKLWNLKKNDNLRKLSVRDFSKISNINEIQNAKELVSLSLEGGMWKPLKIDSLNPLIHLKKLKWLRLMQIKVADESLEPISSLNNLKKLEISNQFPTKEYANLTVKLPKTECSMFQPYQEVEIKDEYGNLVYDRMIIGKRKPFLLSKKDQTRIEKYEKEFEKLKNNYVQHRA